MPVKLKVDVYDRDALSRDEFVASFVIQLTANHLRATPSTLVMSGRTRCALCAVYVTCFSCRYVLGTRDALMIST